MNQLLSPLGEVRVFYYNRQWQCVEEYINDQPDIRNFWGHSLHRRPHFGDDQREHVLRDFGHELERRGPDQQRRQPDPRTLHLRFHPIFPPANVSSRD